MRHQYTAGTKRGQSPARALTHTWWWPKLAVIIKELWEHWREPFMFIPTPSIPLLIQSVHVFPHSLRVHSLFYIVSFSSKQNGNWKKKKNLTPIHVFKESRLISFKCIFLFITCVFTMQIVHLMWSQYWLIALII